MNLQKQKKAKRIIRHKRVRSRISGTGEKPRLAVFKSNTHIYAQVIDDGSGKTIASSSSMELKTKAKKGDAAKVLAKNIKKIKFDRGGFSYHGRIKSLAEGAREGGLEF
jgi:large subunit ribosomal protein L18